jgi:hypothetical protein
MLYSSHSDIPVQVTSCSNVFDFFADRRLVRAFFK